MPKLEISYNNNVARVRSSYPYIDDDMDTLLTYWVKGFNFMPMYKRRDKHGHRLWDGKNHIYNREFQTFPAGLLKRVVKHFELRDFSVVLYDHSEAPEPWHELTEVTYEGPERVTQGAARQKAREEHRGTFEAATGWGKTNLMAMNIADAPVPALCLFHRNELALGAAERFRETLRFKHTTSPIGYIGAGKWEPGLITCASFPTLVAMLAKDKEGTMRWLEQFGQLHVDECHHVPAKTLQHLLDATRGAHWRFGYSATPGKDGDIGAVMEIESWLGPIIYSYGVAKAIAAGILTPPLIYMVDHGFDDLPNHDDKGFYEGTFNEEYKLGIAENKARNHLVAAHAELCAVHELPTLVLVQQLEQGRMIQRYITDVPTRFVHGSSSQTERREALDDLASGRLPLLIASSIFDEGVDVPAIGALSVAGGYKASHKTLQKIGRGLRKSEGKDHVLCFDYWDAHGEHLEKQSRSRAKTYKDSKFNLKFVTPAELKEMMAQESFYA